ncbi:MAG: RNA polymerase sigma factor [Gammaproteobacteria bacterium]|nr:RNA polymerase sigma factor [Gammaproteobacteria bacterium]
MTIFSLFFRPHDFVHCLEQSRGRLYRVAYSWCYDAALADDLVQETLSKALGKSAQLRDPERLPRWLFSILSHCWYDHLRRQRDTQDIDEMQDSMSQALSDPQPGPEEAHARRETADRVRKAVAALPPGQRQVLTLVDLEEFSYGEVAEILDIPIGTVMSRLCRARRSLKAGLLDLQPVQVKALPVIRRIK